MPNMRQDNQSKQQTSRQAQPPAATGQMQSQMATHPVRLSTATGVTGQSVTGQMPMQPPTATGQMPAQSPATTGQMQAYPRYVNPQSTHGNGMRPRHRRIGQERLYRKYVPASGEVPVQLRRTPTAWQRSDDSEPTSSTKKPISRKSMILVIVGVIMMTATVVGGALAIRAVLHMDDHADAAITDSGKSSHEALANDGALGVLLSDKQATEEDLSVITTMFDSLGHEYEIISKTNKDVLSPDDMMGKVSVNGWHDELPGWDMLQLRVRAGVHAMSALSDRYGGKYEVVSSTIPSSSIDEDGNPESVLVACRCIEGEDAGTTVSVAVGLTGKAPTVADNMETVRAQRVGILNRLNAVVNRMDGDLYVGDFALEGFTTPLVKEDGTTARTETWWLYVNSNVAPKDIDKFVEFVNSTFEAFKETAGEDVANIDVTVISCDATDAAMGGKTFSELATELSTTTDNGSRYMDFEYLLRGEASTTTPCTAADLDGTLHRYTWE